MTWNFDVDIRVIMKIVIPCRPPSTLPLPAAPLRALHSGVNGGLVNAVQPSHLYFTLP